MSADDPSAAVLRRLKTNKRKIPKLMVAQCRLATCSLLQGAEVLLQSTSGRIERFVTLVSVSVVAEQRGTVVPIVRLQRASTPEK